MNPSAHLRIDSVIRALEDVVLPAVHTDERATEQLRMSIAHLGVIRAQIDTAALFERFELTGYEHLATTLVDAAGHARADSGRHVEDACRELADVLHAEHTLDPAGVRERATELGRAIENFVSASAADSDEHFRSAVSTAVLRSERRRVDANRAVFLGMGWEPGDDLPDITSILGASTSGMPVTGTDVARRPVEAG
jgi:hypothetical protein